MIRLVGKPGQRGFTLIEVLFVVFILALSALIMSVVFPTSQVSRIKAAHISYATNVAQQQIEQFRSAGYSNVLCGDPVDTPLSEVPEGNQRVSVTQYADGIKKIEVTITWGGYRKVHGSTRLVTLISDHG